MTRTVFCRKYREELPGLAKPPYPGPVGLEIYEQVSQKAWEDWQRHQTLLINEKRLNMASAADRQFLQAEMRKFLDGADYAQAEGYVAPTPD